MSIGHYTSASQHSSHSISFSNTRKTHLSNTMCGVLLTLLTHSILFYRKQGTLKSFSGTETNVIWPKVKDYLAENFFKQ